jgi:hypothetical protein
MGLIEICRYDLNAMIAMVEERNKLQNNNAVVNGSTIICERCLLQLLNIYKCFMMY